MGFRDIADQALGVVTSALGESVTYTPQGGDPVTISGIFDDKVYIIDPGTGTRILSKTCLLEVQLSVFDIRPKQFDSVIVRSVTYNVLEVDQDGAGAATLHLQKQ